MTYQKSFASDNNAGVHPEIMKALQGCNRGHVVGYGDDPYTRRAVDRFKKIFGPDCEVYFVYGGTGANVLGLQALLQSHQAVVCAETAHINVDECGAPEKFTGCKLITLPTTNGKIHVDQIEPLLEAIGFEHHVQPKVISITQATEMGTVYRPQEIKEISAFARKNNMYLHMDGARIANAAAFLNMSFRQFTAQAGVDVLSFGGTKNGMMFGEAVVFFNASLAGQFKYIRKQGMQLHSKMRFISAQFLAYLDDDLWLKNARSANNMAQILKQEIEQIPQIRITQPVETNGIFAEVPHHLIKPLQEAYFFYIWNHTRNEVRWMTSFDTDESDIAGFVQAVRKLIRDN